ncbi:hypothetical protein FJZ48_01945 [Candidatus Uhrbacteria bacterium]|nr:hypothetical protein [Candidatus Uhrbacteria bacterium]
MNVKTFFHTFIRAESVAAILYRSHLTSISITHQPLLCHIARIEEKHRDDWRALYQQIFHEPAPRFLPSQYAARLLGWILNIFGERAILRAECLIERHAINIYTRSLHQIHDPRVRSVLTRVLKDEASHQALDTLLREDKQDEEEHLEKMQEVLVN